MEDVVVVESNSMDFLITDVVVLSKKERVPPSYVVVSARGKRRAYFPHLPNHSSLPLCQQIAYAVHVYTAPPF